MEKSGFFNSVNGDRKYKAEDFANFFLKFITNGVFPNPSTNLQVMAGDGMNVVVTAGSAWINGYAYDNTSDLILPVYAADGVLNRIDRVVVKFDTVNREIKTVIKKGTFASVPVAPTLQRDADAFELGIADINVAKGAISITQAYITDIRLNTDFCGIVSSLFQIDTTTLLNQYEAGMQDKEAQFTQDFNIWFNTIKAALDGDTAGNLLNIINTHKDDNTLHKTASIPMTGYVMPASGGSIAAVDTINQAIGKLEKNAETHKAEKATNTALGHVKQGTGVSIDANGILSVASGSAALKKGSSTFTDRDTSQTYADTFCTANSLVTIAITSATKPQGIWSVESAGGSFTITSTVAETADIAFDYYIQKAVV